MLELLWQTLEFLAKAAIVVASLAACVLLLFPRGHSRRQKRDGTLSVRKLNQEMQRLADPVRSSPTPSDSRARVWARIQETSMESVTSRPSRRWWLAGGLAAAGATSLVIALSLGGGAPAPGGGIGIGSCVETYSPAAVATRAFAFDGVVTAIDGERVTFVVGTTFRGNLASGETVTLTARGMTGGSVTSAGGPDLVQGSRYLVAGEDVFAWACGFTQPYDPAVAAEWEAATR